METILKSMGRTLWILPILLVTVEGDFFFRNLFLPNPFLFHPDLRFGPSDPTPAQSIYQYHLKPDQYELGRFENPISVNDFKGRWELHSLNSGVSAMHAILLPRINKVLMYDATVWKISQIKLPPGVPCRVTDPKTGEKDCWCHSVLYDIETAELSPLKLNTDTWCSSGGLTVDGNLVGTGGFQSGARTVRYLTACNTCDWREYPTELAALRWYSTQATLPDGAFIVVGGRAEFNYEYIPAEGKANAKPYKFPFLFETKDKEENNLYPFVHLSTDGNIFIFANNRSVMLDPQTNKIVRELPVLPGGARNYPASGMSVLLPIRLHAAEQKVIPAEVLICGGAKHDAYFRAENLKVFDPALDDCGRISLTRKKAVWKMETMPSRRVMGDMVLVPTGDVIMLNGAQLGSSGWGYAREPNLTPVLYMPRAKKGQRFQELEPSNIPRMYHSSTTLLPDGKLLVAGSNTNNGYHYNVMFPTELRVEKFWPPYLNPALDARKPQIMFAGSQTTVTYGQQFTVQIQLSSFQVLKEDTKVTMYAPSFTTHGVSMNQRLIILGITRVDCNILPGLHNVVAVAPPSGKIAPPGYYLTYVVVKDVPSVAMWVQIK